MKTIGVVFGGFEPTRSYSYKTNLSDLEIGEYLVAQARGGYATVKVVRIDEEPDDRATAWAFQKVDTELAKQLEENGNLT